MPSSRPRPRYCWALILRCRRASLKRRPGYSANLRDERIVARRPFQRASGMRLADFSQISIRKQILAAVGVRPLSNVPRQPAEFHHFCGSALRHCDIAAMLGILGQEIVAYACWCKAWILNPVLPLPITAAGRSVQTQELAPKELYGIKYRSGAAKFSSWPPLPRSASCPIGCFCAG